MQQENVIAMSVYRQPECFGGRPLMLAGPRRPEKAALGNAKRREKNPPASVLRALRLPVL